MIKPIHIALMGALAASTAALAQTATPKTAAECDQIWKSADANGDGKLDATEMEASKSMLPMSMQQGSNETGTSTTGQSAGDTTASTTAPADDMTTQQGFAAACMKG